MSVESDRNAELSGSVSDAASLVLRRELDIYTGTVCLSKMKYGLEREQGVPDLFPYRLIFLSTS